ncbi:protein gamma response 1 [Lotus japonicus]|uniref:protein gamma response 1 n=1 Tax=Lotus japonicus TaxID=34305 RepID=UPI0025841665|nr:protein gamma response 1 [Lotus japonicus]
MAEQDVAAPGESHRNPPKLGFPLPPAAAGDEKLISGLSTILVASIQEARDRISQIEYVFCSQIYPHFQSTSKHSDSKRRRIEELEREVDEGMALHKTLTELVRSKELSLRASEEKRKSAVAKLERCESETASLLGRIDELEERLRRKTREAEELELKRVESEGSYRNLVENVESMSCELQAEKLKRNRLTEAYKRLKSQHVYLRQKVGLTEENMLSRSKSPPGSDKHQSPVTEPGLAFEDPDITMGACKATDMESEIPEEDFGGLENATPDVFVSVRDANEVKEKTLGDDRGANLIPPSSSFYVRPKCPSSDHPLAISAGLENTTPDVFVSVRDANEVKEKTLEDDRGGKLIPPSSSFYVRPKCPSSAKVASVSGTKRPAPSWRLTRSHQSRAGPDPHDDFLDTPLENIRVNLNKDLNKADLPCPIQKDISMNSSDDETQDLNAESSPQKKQSSITVADKRSFKYIEPVMKKAELEHLNKDLKPGLPCPIQRDKCMDSSDDETQDLNAKSSPQKKQSSITVADKKSFKYIEPVRKKAERENLKGVECKQCRKFYDAVLPNADGKDPDNSKQNFRCEHLDGVSRHRYRYVPPMTPEGFWNIGFESEM